MKFSNINVSVITTVIEGAEYQEGWIGFQESSHYNIRIGIIESKEIIFIVVNYVSATQLLRKINKYETHGKKNNGSYSFLKGLRVVCVLYDCI